MRIGEEAAEHCASGAARLASARAQNLVPGLSHPTGNLNVLVHGEVAVVPSGRRVPLASCVHTFTLGAAAQA